MEQLVEGASRGEAQAFSALYDELMPLVWERALTDSCGATHAQALTAEAFVCLWRDLPRLAPARCPLSAALRHTLAAVRDSAVGSECPKCRMRTPTRIPPLRTGTGIP